MSVATEFAPDVYVPERAVPERARAGAPLATVTMLYRPSERAVAPPLRLTQRGVVVLAAAFAVLAAVLIGVAWLSAPDGASGGTVGSTGAPVTVTVESGDSLWTIATRIAPQRDPRAEIADLQRVNHLGTAALVPGQVLRTR